MSLVPALTLLLLAIGCDRGTLTPPKPPRLTSPQIAFEEGTDPGIHLVDPETGWVTNFPVAGPYASGAAISPDGTRIAFARPVLGIPSSQLLTMAVDGTDIRSVTNDSAYVDWAPCWSSDGKYLAFLRGLPGHPYDVYIVGANGGAVRRLTTQGRSRVQDWSPDGKRILLTDSQVGDLRVATVAVDGSDYRIVIQSDSATFWDAAYSPDGSRIAVAILNPPSRLEIMNTNGSDRHTVIDTSQVFAVEACSWSPDGQAIVIAAIPTTYSGGNANLMIYRLGEKSLRPLFSDGTDRDDPDWGPKP